MLHFARMSGMYWEMKQETVIHKHEISVEEADKLLLQMAKEVTQSVQKIPDIIDVTTEEGKK